jgi:hypothetical protein
MGLLAAAGFITGEALLGIGLAVPVAAMQNENAIALFKHKGIPALADFWEPSVVMVCVALVLLYRLAFKPPAPPK